MFNTQKQKEAAYTKKIQELHKELEGVSFQLSSVYSERDSLKNSNSRLHLENNNLSVSIEKKKVEIDTLNILINECNNNYAELVKSYSDYQNEKESKIKELTERYKEINKDVLRLTSLKQEIDVVDGEYNKKVLNVVKLSEKEKEIMSSNAKKESLLDSREKKILEEEERLFTSIKKNGKILVDTENNLRTIELYAKRLQRYYNETGLNIHILEQFNINQDNK